MALPEDFTHEDAAELERRMGEIKEQMRPLEEGLMALRGQRDLLQTELRRRRRLAERTARAGLKVSMRDGEFPTVAELVSASDSGSLDDYFFNLKTGGQVRLGFPGSRAQTLTFTDGVKIAQAQDLAEAARLYAAGWELGSPGRPGVRTHFPGTRQERLVRADEVYARPASEGPRQSSEPEA